MRWRRSEWRWWRGGWIALVVILLLPVAAADPLDGLASQIAIDQRTGEEPFAPLPKPSPTPIENTVPGASTSADEMTPTEAAAPIASGPTAATKDAAVATPAPGAVTHRLAVPLVIHRRGGPSERETVAADLVRRGSEALHARMDRRAARLLATAVRMAPANGRAHTNLGAAYLRLGDNERAVAELETAVALTPELAAAWSNLGLAEARLGRTAAARTHLQQAAALDPDDGAPLVNLARVQAAHGEREAALLTLRRALTRRIVPAAAHLQLALLLERAGRRGEAATHLELYLATNVPRDSELTGRLRTHLAALRGGEGAVPDPPAQAIGLASGEE